MKYAHFNPVTFAIDDVPLEIFTRLRSMVDEAHSHLHLNDAGNQEISVRGGQQIQLLPNEFRADTTVLQTYVETKCEMFIDSLMKQSGKIDLTVYKPCLVSAWTIKQGQGHYQALHNHEAHISGNIYLEVPDFAEDSNASDGCLEFRLPTVRNPSNFIFVDQWRFKPQICKMVIFPSYIPHTVYPWKGEGHRTVLAWDVKLVQK